MDSGSMHHFVGADSSCISWGHAQYGELGFGPTGQKYVFITFDNNIFLRIPYFQFKFCLFLFLLLRSSATPKKVDILEGMHVIRWVFIYIFIIFIYLLCFYYNCTYRMWQWISFFFFFLTPSSLIVLHVVLAFPWWLLIEQMLLIDLIKWVFKTTLQSCIGIFKCSLYLWSYYKCMFWL